MRHSVTVPAMPNPSRVARNRPPGETTAGGSSVVRSASGANGGSSQVSHERQSPLVWLYTMGQPPENPAMRLAPRAGPAVVFDDARSYETTAPPWVVTRSRPSGEKRRLLQRSDESPGKRAPSAVRNNVVAP